MPVRGPLSCVPTETPTNNGYAERFVDLFKLAVAERRPYRTLGVFLYTAQNWINFYNQEHLPERLDNLSPRQYAEFTT